MKLKIKKMALRLVKKMAITSLIERKIDPFWSFKWNKIIPLTKLNNYLCGIEFS